MALTGRVEGLEAGREIKRSHGGRRGFQPERIEWNRHGQDEEESRR